MIVTRSQNEAQAEWGATNIGFVPASWPQLLSRQQLSAYLTLSPDAISRICPVAPLELGVRVLRWRRADIDAWLEGLPVRLGSKLWPEQTAADSQIDTDASRQDRRESAVDRVRNRAQRSSRAMAR